MPQTSWNPASHPVRRWLPDEIVTLEAFWLVRRLAPDVQEVLGVLASKPGQWISASELSVATGFSVRDVPAGLARANQFAEAMGFRPLVRREAEGYCLEADGAAIVAKALRDILEATPRDH